MSTQIADQQPRMVWVAAYALIALQVLTLSYLVWDKETLLNSGREIVLEVEPVDPRSLFRGDYVILSYKDLSRIKQPVLEVPAPGDLRGGWPVSGAPICVLLKQQADKTWSPTTAQQRCPETESGPDAHATLTGTIRHVSRRQSEIIASVVYGLERYFVPEGEGKKLEDKIRIQKLLVRVAVDKNGRAIIKGLIVDGQHLANQGLF